MRTETPRRLLLAFLVLGSSLSALIVSGHAAAVDTRGAVGASEPPIVMTPVADTWYEAEGFTGWTPDATPHGHEPRLAAGWNHLSGERRAVVRFAVPNPPPGQRYTTATLRLGIVSAGVDTYSSPWPLSGTMRISLRHMESDWEEASLSSADEPAVSPVLQYVDVPWGPCGESDCGSARIDVTEFVERPLTGPAADNGSLVLSARGVLDQPSFGASLNIGSRESGAPAQLQISVDDIGAPPTEPCSATPTATESPEPTATSSATPPEVWPVAVLALPWLWR